MHVHWNPAVWFILDRFCCSGFALQPPPAAQVRKLLQQYRVGDDSSSDDSGRASASGSDSGGISSEDDEEEGQGSGRGGGSSGDRKRARRAGGGGGGDAQRVPVDRDRLQELHEKFKVGGVQMVGWVIAAWLGGRFSGGRGGWFHLMVYRGSPPAPRQSTVDGKSGLSPGMGTVVHPTNQPTVILTPPLPFTGH